MRERGIMLLLAYLAIDQLMTERNVVSPEFNVSSTAQQIQIQLSYVVRLDGHSTHFDGGT